MKFDLVAFLTATLPFLAQLARLTETTLDDSAVSFAELALTNQDVADFLNSLIAGGVNQSPQHLAAAHPAAHQAAVAAGFDWNQLIASLPGLIALIKLLAAGFGK